MARMLAWRQHRRTGGHRLASRSHGLDVQPVCERLRVLNGEGRDSRMCKRAAEAVTATVHDSYVLNRRGTYAMPAQNIR
jgi:hypothetical protein